MPPCHRPSLPIGHELTGPTEVLPHRIDGLLGVHHIAIAIGSSAGAAEHIRPTGLSDHDAYLGQLTDSP